MVFKFSKSLFLKVLCGLVGVCFLIVAVMVNSSYDENNEWIVKVDDGKISSSEYLIHLTMQIWETLEEVRKRTFEEVTLEDFRNITKGPKNITDFLQDTAKETATKTLICDKRFKDMGLSLTDKEKESIKKEGEKLFLMANGMFQGYDIGFSKKACEDYIAHFMKAEKVREESYKEGKPLAPTKEQLFDVAKNNMVNFAKFSVQKDFKATKEEKSDEEKDKNKISEIAKEVEDLLKEGKTEEEIKEKYKEAKDGILVSTQKVFDFVNDEGLDNKSRFEPKEEKENKKIVKEMADDEIKKVEKGKSVVILKKLKIEDKDIEDKKDVLSDKYKNLKEEEIIKAEIEKLKPKENESALKKYTPDKQIDLVFQNKIERPLTPSMLF